MKAAVIGEKREDGWYPVRTNQRKGFVRPLSSGVELMIGGKVLSRTYKSIASAIEALGRIKTGIQR